jgi:hypothetical protein
MIGRVLYTAAFFLFVTYKMAFQPTGKSVPTFAAPSLVQMKPTMLPKNACHERTTDNVAAPAPYAEVGGAELMAAPVMGGGTHAEDSAATEDQRDEAEGGGKDFVWGGQEKTPKKKQVATCAPW